MSSPAIPSPPSDASATVRGLVNLTAQAFLGPKTFLDDIYTGVGKGLVGGGGGGTWTDNGGGWINTATNTRVDSAGFYIASGGVLGGLNANGLWATAGSYGADVNQAQALELAILSAKGAAAGVVVKLGTSEATPHADAELLRVAYALGGYFGSDGTPVFQVFGDGRAKVTGIFSTTSNIVCGNDFTLNSLNAIIWAGSMGIYGATNGDLHVYGGTSGTLALDNYTDDSANPGNRTVNKARGKSAFAAGAAAVTITNSLVTANSQVMCTLEFADATLTQILRVIPGAGSFVVTGNANATANTKFSWWVLK
jgi:hypothetical protein